MWKDYLYFETGDAHLVSLNAKDGKERWSKPLTRTMFSTLVYPNVYPNSPQPYRAKFSFQNVGHLVVLPRPVAETKLMRAILDLGHRQRQPPAQRIKVHDDENTVDVLAMGESRDRVAKRRVVDDTTIPVVAAADLGPGKLRRQAAACQHMFRRDDHGRCTFIGAVAETGQFAALDIDQDIVRLLSGAGAGGMSADWREFLELHGV